LAQRTFAVVRTEKGENPFDIGVYRNWKSVMGNNIIDWLLPLNRSPCEIFENNESFYEMGPLIQDLRARYSLPDIATTEKVSRDVMLSELNERGKSNGNGNGNIREPGATGL
jgi:palmitoyltransferase